MLTAYLMFVICYLNLFCMTYMLLDNLLIKGNVTSTLLYFKEYGPLRGPNSKNNNLYLTEDLMVELHAILLQHMYLLALHVLLLGYTLCVLRSVRLQLDETDLIDLFKGGSTTLGPLLKHLLIEIDGTRKEEAERRSRAFKRTKGSSEEKVVIFRGT